MATKLLNLIRAQYLRSLKQTEGEGSSAAEQMNKGVMIPSKENKSGEIVTHRAMAVLTFKQLEASKLLEESLAKNKDVLDCYSWQDLNLLCGNQATPNKNVHAKIDRTVTTLGKCVLATTLVSPSGSQEEVARKQQITKVLCEDAALKKNIGAALSRIKEDEAMRASLWSASSPLKHEAYKHDLQGVCYQLSYMRLKGEDSGATIYRPDPTSARALQRMKDRLDYFIIFSFFLYLFLISLGLYFMWRSIIWTTIVFFVGSILCVLLFRLVLATKMNIINFLAKYMATLQTFLKLAHEINEIVMSHPKLKELYEDELKAVRYLWAMGKKKSKLGQVIRAMQGPSWKNWRYFRGPIGQLLAGYTLFEKHKGLFANAFYEIGKVDVHYSTASLIAETEGDELENGYVLSDVLAPKAKDDVIVKGERIWHPCLAREVAVANDLSLDSQKGNRLIVITGANMGGKSTYILSSGLAALLSQCFGIAPAKSFSHTCFKKFMTYVNPSQNLARGLSLSEAAFEVLKTHKNSLEATDGPVFAIVDEILNGVDAKMGLEVSREALERRYKKYPNCVTLLTTHYVQLSELDRLPGVTNKHVDAIFPDKGMSIKFTYKILNGASTQNIVKEIVTNMGILDEIR